MKGLGSLGRMVKSSLLMKTASILLGCIAAFLLGKHWSDESQELIFFTRSTGASEGERGHYVAISPNANRTFDISSLISNVSTFPPPPPSPPPSQYPPPPASLPPPPPPERFGVVNENGEMNDRFATGVFDPDLGENSRMGNESEEASGVKQGTGRVIRVKKFQSCPATMREYIPCLDNWEAIEKLNSTDRGEKFERHCPEEGKGLNCLVPAPKNYKTRIPWPKSRDEEDNIHVLGPNMDLLVNSAIVASQLMRLKREVGGLTYINQALPYITKLNLSFTFVTNAYSF